MARLFMLIHLPAVKSFVGEFMPPPDKSITHRAFFFAALARGKSKIINPLISGDTLSTRSCLDLLGAEFTDVKNGCIINSRGSGRLYPGLPLDCGNSGTTARLLCGLLAFSTHKYNHFHPADKDGNTPFYTIDGDNSLRKRPMLRVLEPLRKMGAIFGDNETFPLTLTAAKLHGADIFAELPSAQVKSAVILAGLQAEGVTRYTESVRTRDHSENLLEYIGAKIVREGNSITVESQRILPFMCRIPGDPSAAANFTAFALMIEGSKITIKDVCLNPVRLKFYDLLKSWGAKIDIEVLANDFEPVGNIYVEYSPITGGIIEGEDIAAAIDELPLLLALGLFSEKGVTVRGAGELRFKESDRISAVAKNLAALGADIEEFEDGLCVRPLTSKPCPNCDLKSFGDHRIMMMNVLLAKKLDLGVESRELSIIDVSYPDFLIQFDALGKI